jgi:hypothetical protein
VYRHNEDQLAGKQVNPGKKSLAEDFLVTVIDSLLYIYSSMLV